MQTLVVNTSKTYPVFLAPDFDDLGAILPYVKGTKVAIVSDDTVAPLYGEQVAKALAGKETYFLSIPAGEDSKNIAQYADILEALAKHAFSRQDTVIALGGGVVGDLAAFVASTYMRGIGLVSIPTSLLAMVDSSVGGKTAVNLSMGKNLCGTFYQPDAVYIATRCLGTLPDREVQCGWGEIVKYAFLDDTITLHDLTGDVTPQLIAKCLQIKANIVGKDERESGERKLLNLGHTFGHAIERKSGFALSHGDCVVKGMAIALSISTRYYSLPADAVDKAQRILLSRGHDLTCPYGVASLLDEIQLDKKSTGKGVDMVLLTPALKAAVVPLSFAEIAKLL